MQEQKEVKIINFKATKFGVFQALELDFDKFNQGAISIKGNAGAGKSTIQNGIKTNIQGRNTLSDQAQYGDEWEMETQLVDGGHNIFIGAVKKKNKSIDYKLYEKDTEGKKVMTPVIDGLKATPAKYMDLIATELTFGINRFLSTDATTHRKFMFELFRPELEKLGVIFDKKNPSYENSILGQLDALTYERDKLRSQCTHRGAFMADFARDGYDNKELDLISKQDIETLENQRNELLVSKGKAEGNANTEFEKKKASVAAKGQKILEDVRNIKDGLEGDYSKNKSEYDSLFSQKNRDEDLLKVITDALSKLNFITPDEEQDLGSDITAKFMNFYSNLEGKKEPVKPICIPIVDNRLKPEHGVRYHPDFSESLVKYNDAIAEYVALTPEVVDLSKIDDDIKAIDLEINKTKANNDLFERYEINRKWVEADAKVTQKRKELAKLYAQVKTGVDGLYMKPFFNDDEKMEIKTVYTGNYDAEFFKNDGTDERLLVSYSSTQRPLIGILLQVARLKIKSKALKYIFLDDVPMDSRSRQIITKIAAENGLNIITSITGDFDKDKLTENELLVENGEVFFS